MIRNVVALRRCPDDQSDVFRTMFPAQNDVAYKHIRRALASDMFTQQRGIMVNYGRLG